MRTLRQGTRALLALIVLLVAPSAAHAYCSPIQVIDSRGSGDTGISKPAEKFSVALVAHYRHGLVATESNPYAAVSILASFNAGLKALADLSPTEAATEVRHYLNGVGAATRLSGLHLGAYHDSVVAGRELLKSAILDFKRRCPASSLFLVGYSQGAQVTGDVLSKDLDAGQRNLIAGAALFGDPRYYPGSFADPSSPSRNGILGQRSEFPSDLRGRVLSYCHLKDPVCQGLGLNLAAQHKDYAQHGEPQQAADSFAAGLDLAGAPAFAIKVVPDPKFFASWSVGSWRLGDLFGGVGLKRPPSTLADLDAQFGSDDRCHDPRTRASWPTLGISGTFETLGGFSDKHGKYDPHGTGCKYKKQIYVATLTATGPYWHTDLGLRIGDSLQRLTELYPGATFHDAGREPYYAGWWIVTMRLPWDDPPDTPQPALRAITSGGVVTAFATDINAQGE